MSISGAALRELGRLEAEVRALGGERGSVLACPLGLTASQVEGNACQHGEAPKLGWQQWTKT